MNSNAIKAIEQTKTGIYNEPESYDQYMRTKGRDKTGEEIKDILSEFFTKEELFGYEYGAGTGIVTEQLLKYSNKIKILSTDNSEPFLEYLKNNVNKCSMKADINKEMPLFDGTVDFITGVGTNRYFTQDGFNKFLNESRRVLNKKGLLIIPLYEVNQNSSLNKGSLGIDILKNSDKLKKELENNGFTIKEIIKSIKSKSLKYIIAT